ncbi:MAG: hypothetical protein M0030_11610 [Actinomycetota bacterium]|jgi:hypothetical protein|nr:hypothetical protein [Actinomycetota bacterium]
MIWLTWRQFRGQVIATAALLGAFAIVLAVTGARLISAYDANGIPGCHASGDCARATGNFINGLAGTPEMLTFYATVFLLYALPGLIGAFWGAPLVAREIEAGTLRLVWNQSVTRERWLATKLGMLGLAAAAATGLLTLMTAWWASPIYRAARQAAAGPSRMSIDRISPALFGASGIVPLGYGVFAFALGVTAGVLVRRTIPAMAATLAVFAGVQVAWPNWIRPHLLTPLHQRIALNVGRIDFISIGSHQMRVYAAVRHVGAWIISNQTITAAGRPFTGPPTGACLGPSYRACNAWLAAKHLRQVIVYQPASRYWPLQWEETALFVVLALILAGVCGWRLRRRQQA